MFGFGKKAVTNISMSSCDGTIGLPDGIVLSLDLLEEALQVKVKFGNKAPVLLPYKNVTAVEYLTEKEILEKSKSVVGRAVIGGLFLGGLGAVVGGMSGTGEKKETKHHIYLVINYVSSNGGEAEAISFEVCGATMGLEKFVKSLRDRCGVSPVMSNEATVL